MKRFVFVTLLFGIAAQLAPATHSTNRTLQTEPQKLSVKGLKDTVTIRRDERGIPYIEAKSDEDLYFGQGYATASDRLWQMDLMRRTARGELAEVLGNPALEQDKQHRTVGFAQVAEAEAAQASPQTKSVLEAYARGVNAYIESLDAKSLPTEFQILQYKPKPWSMADSLIVVKLFAEALSNTWRLDLMREALSGLPAEKRAALLPETSSLDVLVVGRDSKPTGSAGATQFVPYSREALVALEKNRIVADTALAQVGLFAEGFAASNNWVISGKRTTSGKPLLSNDPHLAPSAPPIWHMVQLKAPGVHVAGVTAPGLPGVILGHNDYVAWGFTNVGPDVQDVYVEKFDSADPKRYATSAGWETATVRREEIKVRKSYAETTTEVVPLDVTVTRNGPIVFERDGKRYSIRWTALDPKLNSADVTYRMNRARNWTEFKQSLESFTAPTQNIVYADVEGHIGYHAAGVVPIRKSGDGSVPYDGSTDAGQWTSFIPVSKLPNVFDPPSGMIVTANQRIVGTDYPYFLTHSWAQPYRARRIFDLLNEKPKLDANDFRRILGDVYSIAGVLFAKQAAKTLKPTLTPADERLRATVELLDGWDGQVNADSRGALMASQMRIAFRSKILTAALGQELVRNYQWANFDTTLDRIIKDEPADWLPKEFKTYAELYRACYQDAATNLSKNLGEDETKWTWGAQVKARFPHPLAGAPLIGLQFTIPQFPQNGTGGLIGATVNVGQAVSMRLIADPADWDKTQHGITTGESGSPKNPHWSDQLDDWKAVTPRVFPFSDKAVAAATKETLVLSPNN